jgi:uncharacterized protein (DUF3084 family)
VLSKLQDEAASSSEQLRAELQVAEERASAAATERDAAREEKAGAQRLLAAAQSEVCRQRHACNPPSCQL